MLGSRPSSATKIVNKFKSNLTLGDPVTAKECWEML